MYVDSITHAPVHVWLCDNARPAWQAPCIIALGRELHNNVVQGNACGLEPSPKCCSLLPAASSHARSAGDPIRRIFPHARWCQSFRNPNEFLVPPPWSWEFTYSPPAERRRWQTELQRIREAHCVPGQTHRQNRWSRVLSLLPSPHRQKQKKKKNTLTDSKCLFT